jgi:Flp pilus assembly protein TadD
MRVNCRPPLRSFTVRVSGAAAAGAAVAACLLVTGCQTVPLDHLNNTSTAFNANHMPTGDRPDGSSSGAPATTAATTVAKENSTPAPAPSSGGSEAAIVENLNLGHREAALNRLDQAEAYYRRVLELQPDHPVANHRLAVLADKKHDYARAEHYYMTALRREPRNADVLSDLGYSYMLQGRRQDSERCLTTATQIDPSHGKALHNLSLLYAMNGDYDRSFDALRRADGEIEARAKIARLFPQGRPQAKDSEAMVASFQPASAENAQPGTVQSAQAAAPTIETAGPPTDSAPPSANPHHSSGRIPDGEINDRFAAIDRETEPANPSMSTPPAAATNSPQSAAAANGFNTTPVQAAPSADPLASMPLWSPGASSPQAGKIPAAFEYGGAPSATQAQPTPQTGASPRPRVVATDITPDDDIAKTPTILSRRDALSAFDAELQKEKANGAGRSESNGGSTRGPLIVDRDQDPTGDAPDPQRAAGASAPAPFDATPPIRIQPKSTPAPLFEPLDDFGPGNDFAPGNKVSVPAWPNANGTGTIPAGNATDAGPVIRPGSPN